MSNLLLPFYGLRKVYFINRIELFLIVLISFACNSQNKREISSQKLLTAVSKEIPTDRRGRSTVFYREDSIYTKLLGLQSLESGYDSIQIRVWFIYGLLKKRHLLILRKNESHWKGCIYTMLVDRDPTTSKRLVLEKKIQNVDPSSGWNVFINKIFKLGIVSLPDDHNLEGYSSGVDVANYDVEIATKNSDRFYTYVNPKEQEDKFWQAKNMEQILQLIEAEFGFKRPE